MVQGRTGGAATAALIMQAFCVLIGLELMVLIAIRRRIKENRRLCNELRRCHADLAAALAHLSAFAPGFDIVAARRLVTKWPDFKTRTSPPPPGRDLNRLH